MTFGLSLRHVFMLYTLLFCIGIQVVCFLKTVQLNIINNHNASIVCVKNIAGPCL